MKATDGYRDWRLRQQASDLSIGIEKRDVLNILGVPGSETFTESGAVSLSCYTSDSFGSQDDCGPLAVAFRDDRVKIIMITGPNPQNHQIV